MIRRYLILLFALLVLGSVNYLIMDKERNLKMGRTVLLELAPVDPRSLIQGDYMRLRYAIAGKVPEDELEGKGRMVVLLDENSVAGFVRLYKGEELNTGECLLLYRDRGGLRLGAESFFFQEGDAGLYSRAKYGELKVDSEGKSVLVGLRGEDFIPLGKKE